MAEHTAAALVRMRLRHPDGSLSDERIPLLDDLVAAFPAAKFNIDAKEPATVGPLGDALERLTCSSAAAWGRSPMSGSTPCGAVSVRRCARRWAPGGGPGARCRLRPARRLGGRPGGPGAGARRCRALAGAAARSVRIPVVDRFFLAACRRLGVPVHVWTVNDAAQMEALLDRGVHGFMTDRPSVAADVLRRRGAWPPRPTPT
ncbi:MAG: glycerophosphodiester phosphodiesterase family protein [Acidimicrobiales bacterium]